MNIWRFGSSRIRRSVFGCFSYDLGRRTAFISRGQVVR